MHLITKISFLVLFGKILTQLPLNINYIKNQHVDLIYQKCGGDCNAKFCKIIHTYRPFNRTSKYKKLEVNFNPGVKFEAPLFLQITTYKKFQTLYKPLMIHFKEELCRLLILKDHPLFGFFRFKLLHGNFLDLCPFTGRRYAAPRYTSTYVGYLVPVGEWRTDFIVSKNINGSEEHIFTVSDYVLIEATGAVEF